MSEVFIYDRNGAASLRLLRTNTFVSFRGIPLGFFDQHRVYDFNGSHRGWFSGGILRDLHGCVVGFSDDVTDSIKPILPIKKIPPIPMIARISPMRPVPSIPYLRPISASRWSEATPTSLFG